MTRPRLLFVYNADSGFLNALKDFTHKLRSPATYPCSLCAITYGLVAMRRQWKSYIARLPFDTIFLHRDEWRALHPSELQPLPAILFEQGGEVRTLLGPVDMPLGLTVSELIIRLDRALEDQAGQGE